MTASEAKAITNKAVVNNLKAELQELYATIKACADRGHSNAFVTWVSPLAKEQLVAKGYGVVPIGIRINWAI